ncbi:MAG: F-box protein [Proteobacteria bacterium]|nr:F-box protein [Pseudomonadota bacterium]
MAKTKIRGVIGSLTRWEGAGSEFEEALRSWYEIAKVREDKELSAEEIGQLFFLLNKDITDQKLQKVLVETKEVLKSLVRSRASSEEDAESEFGKELRTWYEYAESGQDSAGEIGQLLFLLVNNWHKNKRKEDPYIEQLISTIAPSFRGTSTVKTLLFSELPAEMVEKVYKKLSLKELFNVRQVSRREYLIAMSVLFERRGPEAREYQTKILAGWLNTPLEKLVVLSFGTKEDKENRKAQWINILRRCLLSSSSMTHKIYCLLALQKFSGEEENKKGQELLRAMLEKCMNKLKVQNAETVLFAQGILKELIPLMTFIERRTLLSQLIVQLDDKKLSVHWAALGVLKTLVFELTDTERDAFKKTLTEILIPKLVREELDEVNTFVREKTLEILRRLMPIMTALERTETGLISQLIVKMSEDREHIREAALGLLEELVPLMTSSEKVKLVSRLKDIIKSGYRDVYAYASKEELKLLEELIPLLTSSEKVGLALQFTDIIQLHDKDTRARKDASRILGGLIPLLTSVESEELVSKYIAKVDDKRQFIREGEFRILALLVPQIADTPRGRKRKLVKTLISKLIPDIGRNETAIESLGLLVSQITDKEGRVLVKTLITKSISELRYKRDRKDAFKVLEQLAFLLTPDERKEVTRECKRKLYKKDLQLREGAHRVLGKLILLFTLDERKEVTHECIINLGSYDEKRRKAAKNILENLIFLQIDAEKVVLASQLKHKLDNERESVHIEMLDILPSLIPQLQLVEKVQLISSLIARMDGEDSMTQKFILRSLGSLVPQLTTMEIIKEKLILWLIAKLASGGKDIREDVLKVLELLVSELSPEKIREVGLISNMIAVLDSVHRHHRDPIDNSRISALKILELLVPKLSSEEIRKVGLTSIIISKLNRRDYVYGSSRDAEIKVLKLLVPRLTDDEIDQATVELESYREVYYGSRNQILELLFSQLTDDGRRKLIKRQIVKLDSLMPQMSIEELTRQQTARMPEEKKWLIAGEIAQLDRDDQYVRCGMLKALVLLVPQLILDGEAKKELILILIAQLKNRTAEVRESVLEVLELLIPQLILDGKTKIELIPMLISQLKNSNEKVCESTRRILEVLVPQLTSKEIIDVGLVPKLMAKMSGENNQPISNALFRVLLLLLPELSTQKEVLGHVNKAEAAVLEYMVDAYQLCQPTLSMVLQSPPQLSS